MRFDQLKTGNTFWDRCAFAILLVCATGTAILLVPALLIWVVLFFSVFGVFNDEPPQWTPDDYFLHMTAWRMPTEGKVVSVDDTFDYGWRSGGELTVYAVVPPQELTHMMALPGFQWTEWPPPENVMKSVDLPAFNATHYRIERMLSQDVDWRRCGKIVMVNTTNGEVCAHEWRH